MELFWINYVYLGGGGDFKWPFQWIWESCVQLEVGMNEEFVLSNSLSPCLEENGVESLTIDNVTAKR